MFGKRNSMNGLVRLVTSLVLGMVICYSTMSFAQIIPGATCKAENTALSDYVEYFDGRADNGYSASTYVICPLEAMYATNRDLNSVEIFVNDRTNTSNFVCWVHARNDGTSAVSVAKTTSLSGTGTSTLSWTDSELEQVNGSIWYIRCLIPGANPNHSYIERIKYTQGDN